MTGLNKAQLGIPKFCFIDDAGYNLMCVDSAVEQWLFTPLFLDWTEFMKQCFDFENTTVQNINTYIYNYVYCGKQSMNDNLKQL